MFKQFLMILLLGHILGDFYIQTNKMAERKENRIKWVLLHCISYWCAMLLVILPVLSWQMAAAVTAAASMHLLIDCIKYIYIQLLKRKRKMTRTAERNIFFMDQLLHFFCLAAIAYGIVSRGVRGQAAGIAVSIFRTVGISGQALLSWILSLLLIHKPANIAIAKLLMIYRPENREESLKKDSNAGRFIGTLERIIMLIFLSIGQYSAIGLVLTAKSIARYDRISKDKDFAEYYLLGTLLSTAIAIVAAFGVKTAW